MRKHLKSALILLTVVLALLALLGQGLEGAESALKTANLQLVGLACLFFIFSIVLWLISWAYLIKKRRNVGFSNCLLIGFSSVYGALTPVQIGADMLRSLELKSRFGVPYSESIASSMVVKGVKFFFVAVLSSMLILLFLLTAWDNPALVIGLFSGFFVVALAAALFLLPLKKEFGLAIASFFGKISVVFSPAKKLEGFFQTYSDFIRQIGFFSFALVAVLSALSLVFEFLALQLCFNAIGLSLPLVSVTILFVLIAILERTPFLPRGIGLVEGIGFAYLSMPVASAGAVSLGEIAALLIIFDVVRLVVPSVLSIALYTVLFSAKQSS